MSLPLHERDRSAMYTDVRSGPADATAHATWAAVESIGGDLGWYAWSVAWGVRCLADSLAGGPGVRLERPDRPHLEAGDTVDWWRVEAIDRGTLLRLRAETRMPGTAWLDLAVARDNGADHSTLTLTTWFEPAGLAGHLYWLSEKPGHVLVFAAMRRRIAQLAAERLRSAA